jgi:hypothetical protein
LAALWLGTRTDNPWWALVLRHETIAVVSIWMIFAHWEAELAALQPL